MTEIPVCPHCGKPSEPGDVFCMHCGGAVPAAADAEGEGASPWRAVLARLEVVTQGRFTIDRELGEGGMAAVYLARDVSLQRKVAIKVLSPAMLMERGMVGRFKQEAVTIAALRHPNIVTVHGVEHHDQLHFFVLDFVEGGSLEQVLARYGPLPIPAAVAWLAQVAGALEYAHRRGVIHRDIKPGNILLDRDGNAIVTDFGIAKVAEKSGLTQTGTTMGTPSYMSPEQCLARPLTGASDQYALGIVAWEMLAGQVPFSGSALEVMRSHTDDVPPPITLVRPDCPPEVARAVARMLEKDAAARWPNLAEAMAACGATPPAMHDPVWQQLAGLARGDSTILTVGSAATPTTPLPGRPVAPRRTIARRTGLVGAGVVAAAAVIGGFLFTRDRNGQAPPEPLPATAAAAPAALDTARGGGLAESVTVEVTAPADTAPPPRPARTPARVTLPAAPVDTVEAVGSVTVTPDRLDLEAGQSATLAATVSGTRGSRLADRPVSWQSTNPAVATVGADGRVTGVSAGVAIVSAAADGRAAPAAVTVRAPAPALTDEDAGRRIRDWIERFASGLDAAIRARDLAAVRRAYGAPMPSADVAEWQERLGLDARWQAAFARTYTPRRVGTTWVSDFEITITVESAGRRQQNDQRFFAVFEPGAGGGITVTSLEMRLAER